MIIVDDCGAVIIIQSNYRNCVISKRWSWDYMSNGFGSVSIYLNVCVSYSYVHYLCSCWNSFSLTYLNERVALAGYYSNVWKTIFWSGNVREILKILNEPC